MGFTLSQKVTKKYRVRERASNVLSSDPSGTYRGMADSQRYLESLHLSNNEEDIDIFLSLKQKSASHFYRETIIESIKYQAKNLNYLTHP